MRGLLNDLIGINLAVGVDRAPKDRSYRQIEFELEKAERGMAMPYDAENVARLRGMLQKARAQNLSAGLRARRKPEGIRDPHYEIFVDGVSRSYCERQDIALQTARFLKSRKPQSVVKLKDLKTGKVTVVAFK